MSKLRCPCGYTIADQADDIPYKARFVRDKDWSAYRLFSHDISAFIKAISNGQREQWIQNYFFEGYPRDISDAEVIHDIISMFAAKYEQDIYQCEKCGRIAVQKRGTQIFQFYKPENENVNDIFDVN